MSYMLHEKVRLLFSLLLTKIYFPSARLIRFPSVIRGRASIEMGNGFTSGYYCRVDAFDYLKTGRKVLHFGKDVQINDSVHIAAGLSIRIEDNVLIASRVFITDHNHGSFPEELNFRSPPGQRPLSYSAVSIGKNVWIGEGVIILPGVSIGQNAIVGAGAVVTASIPAHSIAVGNPARVIKRYDFETCRWCALDEN